MYRETKKYHCLTTDTNEAFIRTQCEANNYKHPPQVISILFLLWNKDPATISRKTQLRKNETFQIITQQICHEWTNIGRKRFTNSLDLNENDRQQTARRQSQHFVNPRSSSGRKLWILAKKLLPSTRRASQSKVANPADEEWQDHATNIDTKTAQKSNPQPRRLLSKSTKTNGPTMEKKHTDPEKRSGN